MPVVLLGKDVQIEDLSIEVVDDAQDPASHSDNVLPAMKMYTFDHSPSNSIDILTASNKPTTCNLNQKAFQVTQLHHYIHHHV
jgi:hypothetical protein